MSSNRSLKPAIKKVLEAGGIVPGYTKISKTQIANALPDEDPDAWDPMVAYYVRNCLLAYETDEGLVEPLYPASMMQGDSHKKKLKIAKKFRLFPVAASSSDDVVADLDTGRVCYLVGHSLSDGEPMKSDMGEFEDLVAYFKSQHQPVSDGSEINKMTLRTPAQLRRQSPEVRLSTGKVAVRENDLEWLKVIMESGLREDIAGPLANYDALTDLFLWLDVGTPELAQYLAGDLGLQFSIAPSRTLVKPENLEFVLQLKRLGAFPAPCIPVNDQWAGIQRMFKEKYGIEVKL